MEGIYAAYVTGTEGYSVILFAMRNGTIVGADVGGVKYDGTYIVDGAVLKGNLNARFPANGRSITGAQMPNSPSDIAVPFEIRTESINTGYFSLQTPIGLVSGSLQRLQDLP